jgi:transposase
VAALAVTARAVLSDAQWAVLAPLLPSGKKPGRPPVWTKRQLINGIRWRVRAGCPWRDLPGEYGNFMWNQKTGCQALWAVPGPDG